MFNKDKQTIHGLSRYCRACNKKKCSGRYLKNKERHRDDRLHHDFGISAEEYDQLLEKQGGGCAICGEKPRSRRLAVDHDHVTGRVRGLLCDGHNLALGHFKDRPDHLRIAAEYLERGSL
jgi:hypothetical protein